MKRDEMQRIWPVGALSWAHNLKTAVDKQVGKVPAASSCFKLLKDEIVTKH